MSIFRDFFKNKNQSLLDLSLVLVLVAVVVMKNSLHQVVNLHIPLVDIKFMFSTQEHLLHKKFLL